MMKNSVLIYCAALCFIFASCSKKKLPETAIFTGKISNKVSEKLFITNNGVTDTISLDNDGAFFKKINIKSASYYTLRHGREYTQFFIEPGDSIFLTLNTEKFDESIAYSGSGFEESKFLAEKVGFEESMNVDYEVLFTQSEKKYIAQAEAAYNLLIKRIDKFASANKAVNTDFIKYEKARAFYTWAENKISYATAFKMNKDFEGKSLGKIYENHLKDVNLNDSTLLEIQEFKSYLKTYLENKISDSVKNNASEDIYLKEFINVSDKEINDTKVLSFVIYNAFKENLAYYGIEKLKDIFPLVKEKCKTVIYLNELSESFTKWENISAGKNAPDFELSDKEGKMHKLSDFKNKFVIIDIWATWCAPCRREIPEFAKLHKEFKSKNIAFISISVDENKDEWLKFIEKEKHEWLQLHSEKAKSTLSKDYLVHFIPRFILIGPDGKIINSKAPEPSDSKLKELLQELLNKQVTASK